MIRISWYHKHMLIVAYCCLLGSLVLAFALHAQSLWVKRYPAQCVALLVAGASTTGAALLVAGHAHIVSLGGLAVLPYIYVNLARIMAWRLPPEYIRRSASVSLVWLSILLLGIGVVGIAFARYEVGVDAALTVLAVSQLLVAIIVAASTVRQLRKSSIGDDGDARDGHLPTVTIAVPVRNEGSHLAECLTAALASDYPKMEVLAYDDDSKDRTPDIIRSFAHAGVRFLRAGLDGRHQQVGSWLDKNRAYAELARNASGEYILFVGADIRLGVQSVRRLVALAEARQKDMVSVLPQNRVVNHVPLLQSMRYYWEMAPPRRLFRRPPVLSSCWLVKREMLQRAGGFAAVKQSMSPEAHIAHYATTHNDSYSFVRSDDRLGVYSAKPAYEQRATAVYRRYPQLHRRVEVVAAVSIGQAVLLLGPVVLAINSVTGFAPMLAGILACATFIINSVAFGLIQRTAFPSVGLLAAIAAMPVSVLWDIVYANRSMVRYEFGDVRWKERDVSTRVMR